MRLALRILALLFVLGVFAFWFAFGGTTGWTKTQVEVRQVDPITEIEFVRYQDQLVPGVEFLAIGIGGAFFLLALSFLRLPKPK